jgi:uncharacterized repeat protein (TIGR03806 family)
MLRCAIRHLLLVTILLAGFGAEFRAGDLPAGFAEQEIATGLDPTTMAFAPDGRLFVLEKAGRVRVVANRVLVPTPLLDLSSQVDNWEERGLQTIAFDPDFATNQFFYLYYTAKRPKPHNRVSRFTVVGEHAVPTSEQVVIELPDLGPKGYHNGGGLVVGTDGMLYIATGENTVGARAQDLSTLFGKILRLTRDGQVPSDNPFQVAGDPVRSAIWCLGLRNPFTMARDPLSGRIFVDDVGAGSAEEVNEVVRGANFGWPLIEGQRTHETLPTIGAYHDPLYTYAHNDGIAVCGGDFYRPGAPGPDAFPQAFTGRYFFADYGNFTSKPGWIRMLDPAHPAVVTTFISNIIRCLDVKTAPDGAVWYLERRGLAGGGTAANTATRDGRLMRVRHTGDAAAVPVRLAFAQAPTSPGAGATLVPPVTVLIQDASGATVRGASLAVSLDLVTSPAAGALHGTTTVVAIDGRADFTDLRLDAPGNGYALRATAPGVLAAVSPGFTVARQVLAPRIQPSSGTFSGPVWIQVTSATVGAEVFYTLDGSPPSLTPSATCFRWTGPVLCRASTVVRAVAGMGGLEPSPLSTAELRITGTAPYGIPVRPVSAVGMPAIPGLVPKTLAATGVFKDLVTLEPNPGVIPYTVNSPLWSDGADKARWVALPGSATIGFSATGGWAWPAGTVFIKHFALPTDETDPTARRRLETRLLYVAPANRASYGVTYRWRDDQTDADLIEDTAYPNGRDETVTIRDASGGHRTQVWHYPSRTQCLQCHTPLAGTVLGPKTSQLNGIYQYPGSQIRDNQLRTWNYLRMFATVLDEAVIPSFGHQVAITDAAAPPEARVRSYLDANCAHCHRPEGTPATWDARWDTPIEQQGIIDAPVRREDLGLVGARIVAPQAADRSVLLTRMLSTAGPVQMPPLARNVVHAAAAEVVAAWIQSLPNGTPRPEHPTEADAISGTAVPSFAVKINFQPNQAPTVPGYLVDGGQVFADRGNGYRYGWSTDVAATARDRNSALAPDQLRDTLIHFQKLGPPDAIWEIAVPDGTYQVFAVSGDAEFSDGVFQTDAEGVRLIDGRPSAAQRWVASPLGVMVPVHDGRLTLRCGPGAVNNKINYIEITRVSGRGN